MAILRTINVDLNRQYRNDLNWNFQQIEALTGISTAEIARVERESKERDDFLAGTNVEAIIERIDTSADNADVKAQYASTQGDYAKEQGDYAKQQGDFAGIKGEYADEKAILADTAAGVANTEASNLSQLKIDVVTATQAANTGASNAGLAAVAATDGAVYANEQGDYAKAQGDAVQDVFDQGLVASVNGKTGEVVLVAEDVGAETPENVDLKVAPLTTQLTNHESRLNILESGAGTSTAKVDGLNREVAYLKLQQDAIDRLDGGVTFADDMGLNRFGMTFDDTNSQNIIIRDGKMLMTGIDTITHSAVDNVVVASAYSTAGNGGRKLVRLSNGWLVAVAKHTNYYYFYVDKGEGFVPLCYITSAGIGTVSESDIALVSKGNIVHALARISTAAVRSFTFDATTVSNIDINSTFVNTDLNQTAVGNVSLAIDPTNGHLHAAWASKNAAYPNSFNIRYSKSVDGGVTWSVPTTFNEANSAGFNRGNPSITVNKDGQPVIVYDWVQGASYRIMSAGLVGTTWNIAIVQADTTYSQSNPSAVVDKEGVIHVAWQGANPAGGYSVMYYSQSTDEGATWSLVKLIVSRASMNLTSPSITASKDGNVYVVYTQGTGTLTYLIKYDGESWSSDNSIGQGHSPSALVDNLLDFTTPLTVRMGTSIVLFNGEWSELGEVPKLTASAVYNLPSTDYVGTFVQKTGALTATAFLNDLPMDSDLLDGEYLFDKSLSAKAPATLRIELSRPTITGGEEDAVTRILGGRS